MGEYEEGHEIWKAPRTTATTIGELRSIIEQFDDCAEIPFSTPSGQPLDFSGAGNRTLIDLNGEPLRVCRVDLH